MLISPRSRLFLLPHSSLVQAKEGRNGDLAIHVGKHPIEAGDWFLIPSDRKEGESCFSVASTAAIEPVTVARRFTLRAALRSKRLRSNVAIQSLVTWLVGHYRIGSIRT